MPTNWTCPDTGTVFPTGATPTPRHKLLASIPFYPAQAPPEQVAYVPKKRSNFGNDQYGDCVTAEEAFAKSCDNPEHDISEQTVIDYCRAHGTLHGANLEEVLASMVKKGFQVGSQLYNDGPYAGVDYSNEAILKAAIAQGPVKIAIMASALPGGAGSRDGWYSLNSNTRSTDHAVAICGYGTADWLYQQLGVPLPSGLPGSTPGYLLYTWSTIGFVTHAWIMGTTDEAWLRTPTTVGIPPLPDPTPLPPPPPPVAPPITGTLYAKPVGPYIVIYGELATADGSKYIVAPDGNGNYHVIPKVIL